MFDITDLSFEGKQRIFMIAIASAVVAIALALVSFVVVLFSLLGFTLGFFAIFGLSTVVGAFLLKFAKQLKFVLEREGVKRMAEERKRRLAETGDSYDPYEW